MRKLWILVANSSFAQVYEVHGPAKNLKEIHLIDFPDGRKKGTDIYSDRPSRTFDSTIGTRHAVASETDVRTHGQEVLSRQISEYLKKGWDERKYEELAIIAPAEFLGVLKESITSVVKKKIIQEVKRDLPLSMNPYERLDKIVTYLDLP